MPLKIQNSNAFNVFLPLLVLSCSALTDHERRALLRATDPETRRLWFLSPIHTTNGTSPPSMAADLNPNVSAAAAAACMSAGGRVWWWAVSRSRTPTTRCRAGAWCLCDRHHPRCVWEGAGRPWTWLCGRRAAAEARRPTEAHTREEGRTSRMTKISGLGCQQTPFLQPGAIHGS